MLIHLRTIGKIVSENFSKQFRILSEI